MQSLFGLHLDYARTITITGTPRFTGAPVYVGHDKYEDDEFKWSATEEDSGVWTVELEAGDYIVRIEDEDALGPIVIAASDPVDIVTIPLTGTPTGVAFTLAKYATVTTGNPKDPWPPPGTAITLGNISWFNTYLAPFFSTPRSEGDALPSRNPDAELAAPPPSDPPASPVASA